jgi:hypothetical protein
MSELKDIIRRAHAAKKELVATTVRLAPEEESFIKEFCDQFSLTRQDAMRQLLKAGIERAAEEIELLYEDEKPKREGASAVRFHILNTNKRHSVDDQERMLREGIAAAFYGKWKLNINRIKKDDVVFLYENGQGIVAYGKGSGETLVRDHEGHAEECHYQKLADFKVLKQPLSAAEIRKILGRNVVFLKTMSGAPDGQKILDGINAK